MTQMRHAIDGMTRGASRAPQSWLNSLVIPYVPVFAALLRVDLRHVSGCRYQLRELASRRRDQCPNNPTLSPNALFFSQCMFRLILFLKITLMTLTIFLILLITLNVFHD